MFAALTPSVADKPQPAFDKKLITGIWIDPQERPLEGDVQSRMEFTAGGVFRSNNGVGETDHGKWRWISTDTISISLPGARKPREVKIQRLTAEELVMRSPGERATRHHRLGRPATTPRTSSQPSTSPGDCGSTATTDKS